MAKKINRRSLVFSLWSLVFFIFLCSCAKPLHKNKFIIAGTYLEITSPNKQAARIVYEEFRRLNNIFDFYDSQSELSQLNRSYPKPFKASRELIEILQLAQQAYTLSDGAFDVSHGILYDFWKELIAGGAIEEFPSPATISELKKIGGMEAIEIDAKKKTITIKKEGLKIDLGGIAKGYMVDKAVAKLKKAGINSAIINSGGDMYCLGINKDRPWRIGIQDPQEVKGIIETQKLIDEAIATSGNYEQFFEFKGEFHSHIINPRTGLPVKNNILSVSVISKNCTTADSLATAFYVLGLEGIKKFLSKVPSAMRVFVVTKENGDKQVHFFK